MAKPAASRTAKPAAAPKPKAATAKPKVASTGPAHPPYFEVIACRSSFLCFNVVFQLGSFRDRGLIESCFHPCR
jgi:hypothetical protein